MWSKAKGEVEQLEREKEEELMSWEEKEKHHEKHKKRIYSAIMHGAMYAR